MRVLVAGATGVVGRQLVPQLLARGHQVIATTTTASRCTALAEVGAQAVVMDGLDRRSVHDVVTRCHPEVVVHQMTGISLAHAGRPNMKRMDRWFAVTNRLRIEGTDHLLAAAAEVGVEHVVAQSYASWNGIRDGGWVKTEDDPLDPYTNTSAEPVMRALRHLEQAVTRAGGTVLRYGSLYGPGATDDQVELVRRRQYPLIGSGAGVSSWLHTDDAASAAVAAVEQQPGGVFNVVDDEPAPAADWLPHLASCTGSRPPLHVPTWVARPLAGPVAVAMMTQGRGFTNAKAKQQLGWVPQHPSWRQGFAGAL